MLTLEIHAGSKFDAVLRAGSPTPPAVITSFLPDDTLLGTVWSGQSSTPLFTFPATWFESVTAINVTDSGTNYSISPVVTLSGGSPSVDATAYAVVDGGGITAINVSDPGDGYSDVPTVTITDLTGVGATAEAEITLGWQDGQVALHIAGSLTANLDPLGSYRAMITATRGSDTVKVMDFLIKIVSSPGLGTQPIATYCSYQDMLNIAPWISSLQDVDADLEGFYTQRLSARKWLDWRIVTSYRGTGLALFGDPGNRAEFWSGGGFSGTVVPSNYIIGLLASNLLMMRDKIVNVTAKYAVSLVARANPGLGSQIAIQGVLLEHQALSESNSIVAEIDINSDGISDITIPLGVTNTVFS